MKHRKFIIAFFMLVAASFGVAGGCQGGSGGNVPAEIRKIFNDSFYEGGIWGLRVVDLETGKVLINLRPNYDFFIGSVRKVFAVGELLNEIGPGHEFVTPIYKQGDTGASGVLDGELIIVASGDLTMGGRTLPDGSIAITDFDHNEADTLGNAVLTTPNPLQGYIALAEQVAASGITQVDDVVIDDRLFVPYPFRGEFDIRPIFVNDDVVDLIINPTEPGMPASVEWRPVSAAFDVNNQTVTGGPGTEFDLGFDTKFPQCIGEPGCTGTVTGQLPIDYVPPLTNEFPLIGTFRVVEPQNYARTVFIEALEDAGVTVLADTVAQNPVGKLPPKDSYQPQDLVTSLVSLPYSDYAKLILKVSYNIGSDTTLLLYGLTQGVDNMDDALAVEREQLVNTYGIPGDEFMFFDGSGGGDTVATNPAVTKWLTIMTETDAFEAFFDSLPILAVDGSLVFVKNFQSDPTLEDATGQVRAKTGTFLQVAPEGGFIVRGQAFGGYIDAKSGRRLVYELVVNEVPIADLDDLLRIFQDEGTISAILWRDY